MSTPEQILSDFIDAWNAGRRPRVRDFLARVPDGPERDELADQITTWLEVAPTPDYDEATRAAIRAEPAVARLLDAADADAGLWPTLLPPLRERAGLSVARPRGAARRALLARARRRRPRTPATSSASSAASSRPRASPAACSTRSARCSASAAARWPTPAAFGRALRPAAAGGTLFRADAAAEDRVRRGHRGAQPGGARARAGADGRARPALHRRPGGLTLRSCSCPRRAEGRARGLARRSNARRRRSARGYGETRRAASRATSRTPRPPPRFAQRFARRVQATAPAVSDALDPGAAAPRTSRSRAFEYVDHRRLRRQRPRGDQTLARPRHRAAAPSPENLRPARRLADEEVEDRDPLGLRGFAGQTSFPPDPTRMRAPSPGPEPTSAFRRGSAISTSCSGSQESITGAGLRPARRQRDLRRARGDPAAGQRA